MTQTYLSIASNNAPALQKQKQSFDAYALETMIPKMIGYWPASATQFEKHAPVLVEAYREKLLGFTGKQITQALDEMSDDSKRQFAPIAGELKAFLVEKYANSTPERKFIASMASLEMQVCVKCLNGEVDKTQQAVDAEINKLIELVHGKGGEVSGERGFIPLQTILNQTNAG